jgi:hypothetical protein
MKIRTVGWFRTLLYKLFGRKTIRKDEDGTITVYVWGSNILVTDFKVSK